MIMRHADNDFTIGSLGSHRRPFVLQRSPKNLRKFPQNCFSVSGNLADGVMRSDDSIWFSASGIAWV